MQPRKTTVDAPKFSLTPLVLALAAAFPSVSAGQARVGVPPPPAFAVPVPATVPGWRVYGTGAAAPVNTPNRAGGIDQSINQSSQTAIYNWLSFDIGASSSVTFNFPSSNASALNRVTGAGAPSQIFGRLTSQYANPTPGGSPLVGGSIYLINANGILFGRTAQVNTGALIASTLDLDNDDFNAGLTQSITSTKPTFFQTGPGVPDANNFVQVNPGAQITTPDGGRVFLFAKNVSNGGTITTPDGQTVLAAGDQIYLNVPTAEITYASESNANIPALRGLLVEVGTGNGSVANLAGGTIDTPRGNTTLVGMTVNQSGRISATTSVSDNGSVLLLARGGAQAQISPNSGIVSKRATVEGTLTLGPGSSIEIAPDTTPSANGAPATADSNSAFTTSRVELDGKTVELQSGASIVAHGGIVDVRAESVPYYEDTASTVVPYNLAAFNGDTSARLVIGQGATIDVSGTTDATVSAARNFVTTALLGATDLKDAPLQKDGPIYRSKLTFDVRAPVPILGDTSSYVTALQRTVTEKLAAGGQINLSSTGAVVTHESSTLNVSGGAVNYTSALVAPSTLVGTNGQLYSFNQAPANATYTGILGASTPTIDRWGIVPQWVPSQAQTGVIAPGYVDARAGGTLTVVAPVTVLDGKIAASTSAGVRQTAGFDPLAASARIVIGARNNGLFAFGSSDFETSGVGDVVIGSTPGSQGATFWTSPLSSALPTTGRISASTINASGAGQVVVTSDGSITQQANAGIALPAGAVLDLAAAGANGISIGAGFTSAGGTFSAQTRDVGESPLRPASPAGGVTLVAGSSLNVAGNWVNRALDGPDAAAASAGGSVTLSSARALDVQDASRIDVSGGATVGVNGSVAATSAGNVTLQGDAVRADVSAPSPIHIGAAVTANSLGSGGTFTLNADSITIGSQPVQRGVKDGVAPGSLVLSDAFFDNGAFTAYNVGAIDSLTVQSGVALRPQASNWVLTSTASTQPTGTSPSSFLMTGQLPDAQRKPVSLTFTAASRQGNAVGDLMIGSGASIQTDPLASVTLAAGLQLQMNGSITAHGGNVAVGLVGAAQSNIQRGVLSLGAGASIDVSGQTILDVQTGAVPTGRVLAGGNVTLGVSQSAALTPIVLQAGSTIYADGTSALLGVNTTTASGAPALLQQVIASNGGSVTIGSQAGGSVLAGSLHALGGGPNASAGTFVLHETLPGAPTAATIVVQQAPVSAQSPIDATVVVSADALHAGFANVTLQSQGAIRFAGDVSLSVAGNLDLDAPVISASPASRTVSLAGASTLEMGSSYQPVPTAAGAIGGGAAVTLQGGLVELFGQQVVQGAKTIDVVATNQIRLSSMTGIAGVQGGLAAQADLTLDAPQIAPTTNSQYVIDASGQRVLLTGGDTSVAPPLSAGGSLTINARDITTIDPSHAGGYAVVRAPFGSLTFNATDRIDIGNGSLLSVSGAGLTVPYGTTTGGQNWAYDNASVQAPVAKTISLNAPGQAVNVAAGAKLDLSGGGDLVAQEFVPGIGGSKDIFAGAAGGAFAVIPSMTGYAPQDTDILAQTDTSGQHASYTPGLQITFGSGGPLPAGTYAVLPARYATLPGAFLVTPVASTAPLALGVALPQTDGTTLIGGRFAEAETMFGSSVAQSFSVQTSALARTHSEIDQTNANTYFTSIAAAAGQVVPALPTDAGRLDIVADQLNLKGTTVFALPTSTDASGKTFTTGRGGELDISASAISITNSQTVTPGVLTLSAADLNATGASLLVLGGQRTGSNGDALNVTANSLVVDNAGVPLKINDLVLVANSLVQLKPGADIEAPALPATGSGAPAPALSLTGDGALLRVSSDPVASSTRTGAQRASGVLDIGAGATISGGAVTAEATSSNVISGDATLDAQAITIGANRIAIGDVGASTGASTTLVVTPSLAAQIGSAQSLTLRSFDGVDLYGSLAFGGPAVHSLTLDAGTIRLIGSDATATIEAGGITLTNTSGSNAVAVTGSNTLQIKASATDTAAGSGQIQLSAGSIAVAGANNVTFTAASDVVLHDGNAFAAAGNVTLDAASLQASKGASATLSAGGIFQLDSGGKPAPTGTGIGAHIEIDAPTVVQGGNIVLPSGQLTINASGGAGTTPVVRFSNGSLTDLSGRSSTLDSVVVATSGGALAINVPAGDVALDAGATIDVSAPASGGHAGSIAISAPTGAVSLQGALRGTAATGQIGGTLAVDSGTAVDLAALATMLDAVPNNFGESIDLRNRRGDQQFATGSGTLSARHLSISADTGRLSIAGHLDASGASGTTIALAGGSGLDIESGAQITAHSTGAVGGQVRLASGNLQLQADGTFSGSNGPVRFDGGSIDTTGAGGGANGSLLVRAQRNATGTDVLVGGTGGTSVQGTASIEIEGVKQYGAATVDTPLISTINSDNATLAGPSGANASLVLSRVAALLGQSNGSLQVRSGVEVDSLGDLTVTGNTAAGGWNLTQFSASGKAIAQPTGAPMDLTLRAEGNLYVAASISDGFLPSGPVPTTSAAAGRIVPGAVIATINGGFADSANIQLVGGADLQASDTMKTVASTSSGDVLIGAAGKNVLVRGTTGDIQVAAGRDVVMLNRQAAVYTTGTPSTDLGGYVGNNLNPTAYIASGSTAQTPFLDNGGSLSITAGRDIVGVSPDASLPQFASEWSWRARDSSASNAQPMWWSRYDQFQQGFATFGGGNVVASAQRDIVDGEFSAASSGYVARDANGNPAAVKQFGVGDLSIHSGRDTVGGFVLATGANGQVEAGRSVVAGSDGLAIQVLHGNTAVTIGAQNDLDLGIVTSFGLVPATKEYLSQPLPFYLLGLAPSASLEAVAGSGDMIYQAQARTDNGAATAQPKTVSQQGDLQDKIIPDTALFAAPGGNIMLGQTLQQPAGTTSLNALAGANLTVAAITVNGTDARSATPTAVDDFVIGSFARLNAAVPAVAPYDSGVRTPMRLVAQTGDLVVDQGIATTTALRAIAGRDISLGPTSETWLGATVQHQSGDEVSLVEAGRDILFPNSGAPRLADLQFYGPGNLIVIAERNIDLSTSGGIEAIGNRQNVALPASSGNVTVLAGVNLAAGDYGQAIAWFFPLLGGTGIAGHAGDLDAQLTAAKGGQPLPAIGSAAAVTFSALPIDSQVMQTKALVGETVFDAAVLADAQRRDGNGALSLAQAMTEFATLAAADKATVVAAALATAWTTTLTAAQQQQQALAMAQGTGSGNDANLSALQQFMVGQGASSTLTPAQALAAYQALAPERQLLFANQVLIGEIRKAGRAASALAGAERDAAYQPAYAALDVVFPQVGTPGNLSMGSSQIHTLQDSAIDIMAPRGSVDVGTLVAGPNQKAASSLGIVTGAGGDISVVVDDSVNVNQSRVFTVGKGDLLMWASNGSLDAGRGAKTITGAPPPVFSLDSTGHFIIDTSGSFSGSGIAVLDASSTLDLYAPKGEINAGDAGIKSLGNAFFGAARFVGADNLSVSGSAVGAPPPASTGGTTAGLAAVGQSAAAANTQINSDDSDEEKARKRRRRLNLILDFLGFGDGTPKP